MTGSSRSVVTDLHIANWERTYRILDTPELSLYLYPDIEKQNLREKKICGIGERQVVKKQSPIL